MICPRCRQDAPTILRGLQTYCTACGAPRSITDAPDAVNVAGQPSQVGGTVARVMGWLALVGGLFVALLIGALFQAIFPAGIVGWVVGVPIALLTLILSLTLILGGRKLKESGEDRSRRAREQALFTLASRHRGVITVPDAARALSIPEAEADALLTTLAKNPDGRVVLEVDDSGRLLYMFPQIATSGQRVNVPPPKVRVASPWQEPRVVDTELAEEEAAAAAPGAHRSRWGR
jgi:hypothetical protein